MNLVLVVLLALGAAGCGATGAEKGALIGAAAGAVVGGVVAENTATGAILGAAVGGVAGAIIGDYMDKQAEELDEELEGATVERVGEGIKITFDSGLLFEVDSAMLSEEAKVNLTEMGRVLNQYPDTNILIEGHTDATGSEQYNQDLSERRAKSVSVYLVQQNVAGGRMTTVGYGEMQPVATNESASGREANRRVEVAIMANEELRAQAEKQAAGQGE
jgi:outer membrane protein OmpA-like peptidoglycan-associated protein